MYKLVGLFALVAVVVGNDLAVGSYEGNKIFDQKLEASPAIWRQVKNVTVNATDGDVITRVVVTDLRLEKDGEAEVVEGGEGHKNVTIQLKSPAVFRGFEFNVEVYAKPENPNAVPTAQPKTHDEDNHEPKVPISVADVLDDNLRKTRKTEGDKDVTTKVPVTSEVTTASVIPVSHHSDPSTTEASKDGVKINVPVNIGKDATTVSNEPTEKTESDVIDPLAVRNQPTHMSSGDSTSQTDKAVPETSSKTNLPETTAKTTQPDTGKTQPETEKTLPESNGLKTPLRNVRRTEDPTTESDVSSTTPAFESTTELESASTEYDGPEVHYFSWNANIDDVIKPIGNQGLSPPKTIGSDNVAVNRPSMAPLPYTH